MSAVIFSIAVATLFCLWRGEVQERKHAERMWKHHEAEHDRWWRIAFENRELLFGAGHAPDSAVPASPDTTETPT